MEDLNRKPITEFLSPMNFSSSKVIATTAACATAGMITYPAEMFRLSFTHTALANWNFEHIQHQEEGTQIESLSKEAKKSMLEESENLFFRDGIQKNSESMFTKYGISKQKLRMLLSPLVRLTSHELALHSTAHFCEKLGLVDQSSNGIYKEISAGSIAGICQAFLLCPLEVHRAHRVMEEEIRARELHPMRHWLKSVKEQLSGGATSDPVERRKRAFSGVGILAMREIVFNVSFFPMFSIFKKYFKDENRWELVQNTICKGAYVHVQYKEGHFMSTVASGVLAGVACSLAVTPMDVMKTYMTCSREEWSVWTGKRVSAPPLSLLFRGLTMHAFVFGPTFGVVAAIYELA